MTLPVQAISAAQVLQQASTPGPGMQALSDRFNQLMAAEPHAAAGATPPSEGGASVASRFIGAQEQAMHQMVDDVHSLSREAPMLSVQELAARHIALTYQVAMVGMQFNAGVYVAQSSKSGLQTLMKNQ